MHFVTKKKRERYVTPRSDNGPTELRYVISSPPTPGDDWPFYFKLNYVPKAQAFKSDAIAFEWMPDSPTVITDIAANIIAKAAAEGLTAISSGNDFGVGYTNDPTVRGISFTGSTVPYTQADMFTLIDLLMTELIDVLYVHRPNPTAQIDAGIWNYQWVDDTNKFYFCVVNNPDFGDQNYVALPTSVKTYVQAATAWYNELVALGHTPDSFIYSDREYIGVRFNTFDEAVAAFDVSMSRACVMPLFDSATMHSEIQDERWVGSLPFGGERVVQVPPVKPTLYKPRVRNRMKIIPLFR